MESIEAVLDLDRMRADIAALEEQAAAPVPVGRPGQRAEGHQPAVLPPGRAAQGRGAAQPDRRPRQCCSSWPRPRTTPTPAPRPRPSWSRVAQGDRRAGGPHPALRRVRRPRGAGQHPRRGRRRGRRRLRRDAACGCTCAGPSGTATRPRSTTPRTRRRPASSRPPSRSRRPYAYGTLSVEQGTHRLVRISPVRQPGPPPDVLRRRRGAPGRRADRPRRDRRDRAARRRLPLLRPRRPGRQHHRLRGPHHPPADRHRRLLPERALADPEQGLAR